jgi:hypothetical protein
MTVRFVERPMALPRKRKTRPGGQPDGSSHMGAWVDGRSRRIQPRWGGITAPTDIGRGRAPRVQIIRRFFAFFGRCMGAGTYCRGGAIGFPNGRFTGGHRGNRPVQSPDGRNILTGPKHFQPPAAAEPSMFRLIRAYCAATARLMIFSRCSLLIRPAISSFVIALLPNCSRNMPPLAPSMIEA